MEIILQIVGFGWQDLIQFYVAPDHMVLDYLVCGWPVLREWDIMKHLDTIMFVQKDFAEIASLPLIETGDDNILFTDIDDQEIAQTIFYV